MKKLPGSRVLLFVVLGLVALVALNGLWGGADDRKELTLAEYQRELAAGKVESAEIVSDKSRANSWLGGSTQMASLR